MMNFLKKVFSDKPETKVEGAKGTVVVTQVVKRAWRNNMWVMTPDGIGIIFQLSEPVVVHLVDKVSGLTLRSAHYASEQLRQAKFLEIPEVRRGDKEKANKLGYE